MQQKTAGTLAHAPSAVVSFPASLKKAWIDIRATPSKQEEQPATESARGDLKAQVTCPTCQVMIVEELLCISRSKEWMASAEIKTLHAQERSF